MQWHQSVAGLIGLTDIAIDALPAIMTLAFISLSRFSMGIGQRPTKRLGAVIATEARRTFASTAYSAAVTELLAAEFFIVAIEASRAFGTIRWSIVGYCVKG